MSLFKKKTKIIPANPTYRHCYKVTIVNRHNKSRVPEGCWMSGVREFEAFVFVEDEGYYIDEYGLRSDGRFDTSINQYPNREKDARRAAQKAIDAYENRTFERFEYRVGNCQ